MPEPPPPPATEVESSSAMAMSCRSIDCDVAVRETRRGRQSSAQRYGRNGRPDGAGSLRCTGPRHVAAMSVGDLPDQRETEAGPGARLADAKERSENALAIALSHAATLVAHSHRREHAGGAHIDLDRWGAMAPGILDQVAHHAAQQGPVAASQ